MSTPGASTEAESLSVKALSRRGPLLVVEDDPGIREALTGLLEEAGFHVAAVANGREGLQVMARLGLPCLVLVDLWMPLMSGGEFISHLREHPSRRNLPVVAMTASESPAPSDVEACLRKPFASSALLDLVKVHCTRQ
ncbi:response regulator [Stigmatella sp. ncwal1]|uniref:Response regulator n=1 Tax=Stigmatella ashevillensis TaxID=2995309 RepID=A0ABT5D2I8_9BACT|nr:response regulator [Stigmatella ashevillena]MDC0707876.1 response regulator [Stigmatella ashevillena]